jgi:hypothetical protein
VTRPRPAAGKTSIHLATSISAPSARVPVCADSAHPRRAATGGRAETIEPGVSWKRGVAASTEQHMGRGGIASADGAKQSRFHVGDPGLRLPLLDKGSRASAGAHAHPGNPDRPARGHARNNGAIAASPKEWHEPRRPEHERSRPAPALAGACLWAIALVRHRRRRAGSGRLLRRHCTRQDQHRPELKAVMPTRPSQAGDRAHIPGRAPRAPLPGKLLW